MTNIKLVSLLVTLSLITITFQNCSSSNSQEKTKTEATTPAEEITSPKTEVTKSEVETANSKEEEKIIETPAGTNNQPQNVESQTEEKSSVESDIQFIRDKYAIITNATNYKVDSTTVECGNGFSRIERRSTDNGELRYLLENHCADHGCLTTHHYFWNKELIFIYRQNYYYAGNSDYKQEHRTYFKNKKMFRCLEKEVSTTKGYEEVNKILKKAANKTVDCTPNKRTPNLQDLINLDLKKAKDFFCN